MEQLLYKRIAEGNPVAAKQICTNYGYDMLGVKNVSDIGICLRQLVAAEGEKALRDIVKIHPDRDIILEVEKDSLNFDGNGEFFNASGSKGCNCGCKNCAPNAKYHSYMNFSGPEETEKKYIKNDNMGTMFMAAMFMTVAVLALKQ